MSCFFVFITLIYNVYMKRIAYILKVGNSTYNVYDMKGNIIGGQTLPGKCQSITTNGDSYSITILNENTNIITTYTYDINNVLKDNTSIPGPKKENIQQQYNKPIIKCNNTIVDKCNDKPKTICENQHVYGNAKNTFLNPVKNNTSRFIHLINFLILCVITFTFTLCVTSSLNPFTLFCFIYSFLCMGYCAGHPSFNFRVKIYKYLCFYILFIWGWDIFEKIIK